MKKKRFILWRIVGLVLVCIGTGILVSIIFSGISAFYALNLIAFGSILIISR